VSAPPNGNRAQPSGAPRTDPAPPAREVFELFELAEPRVHELDERPRLASWDARDSPSQQQLETYLAYIDTTVDHADASGIHLVVHEDPVPSPIQGRDLDNYLLPVAQRLGPNRLELARASKSPRHDLG